MYGITGPGTAGDTSKLAEPPGSALSERLGVDIEQIKTRIKHIREIADDDAMAHIKESELRDDFVVYIAQNGTPDLAEMATEILKTDEIEFSRWFS